MMLHATHRPASPPRFRRQPCTAVWGLVLLVAGWAGWAPPASAQAPTTSGGLGVTPVATPARRPASAPAPRGPTTDLSAPLPVSSPVPTQPPPTVTIAVLPATLTATPITPTATPPPTA